MIDEVPEALEILSTRFDVEGVAVKVNKQTVKVEITDKELLSELTGKTITLTINAKIKSSISDEELVEKYGNKIENIATVSINNNPKKTKGAKFTPEYDKPKKDDKHKSPKTGVDY